MDAASILYRIYIRLNVYPTNQNFQLIVGDSKSFFFHLFKDLFEKKSMSIFLLFQSVHL